MSEIDDIISENTLRLKTINARFNPITGEGSVGERFPFVIPDFPIPHQWLPMPMRNIPLIKALSEAKSLDGFISDSLQTAPSDSSRAAVIEEFVRLRSRYDFPFWAAMFVYVKNKEGGDDVLFRLTRPQRALVSKLEEARLASRPIRIVLLKARQWGGSTTIQIYMAWLQLCHRLGLNSLICAHQNRASDEIKFMFQRMLGAYPVSMLYRPGEPFSPSEKKLVGIGQSGAIHHVPQRNCNIKIGSAESPDSCRGGDYALVHLSEVGLWRKTDGKQPEDIVRSACGGVLFRPMTMIVYESTANGTNNFFHLEYLAAKKGLSQFEALFVPWFHIDLNSLPFPSDTDRRAFAQQLLDNRSISDPPSSRHEPGAFLWSLWLRGATLEAINWYVHERAKFNDHAQMASECPSDDIEAFVHSGAMVFDQYVVEALRPACRPPRMIGEVAGRAVEGSDALLDLHFAPDSHGNLHIWALPEPDSPDEIVANRYLAVVDIGGRSRKADWSVIVVFDRIMMIGGGKPAVVAQWRGHIDHDILAWKAAQIAAFYNNALLVIESNTLESHDRDRALDGDQSSFILNRIRRVYSNLYARKPSEDDIRLGLPRKYGFHTNVSTKPMIISNLIRMVRDNLYVERSEDCLDELLTFERKPNGATGATAGCHDDMLMTRAIGLHISCSEMESPAIVKSPQRRRDDLVAARQPVSMASF